MSSSTLTGWSPGQVKRYKSDRHARWKIKIKPLRETNVGVVQV